MFYCMYNAHADITRMVDENGELAEKYYYDEWGVETETLRYGDVTGDGEVNINDYSLMKRLLLLSKAELTAEQKIVSDLNADSINYFLSDPLRNNPVYGVYQYGKDFKKAVAENDWNTASYKLGVGVINTAEVAASVAIGGKIGGKIPTGKVSVPKVNALSKIGNAIDNFGAPRLAGANGIVISGAVPAEVSVSSSVSAGALGVRAGVAAGAAAGSNIFYSSNGSGNPSGGTVGNPKGTENSTVLLSGKWKKSK